MLLLKLILYCVYIYDSNTILMQQMYITVRNIMLMVSISFMFD